MSLAENRYWKPLTVSGRSALAFNPSATEREWAANYINKEGVTADDISPAADGTKLDTSDDELEEAELDAADGGM